VTKIIIVDKALLSCGVARTFLDARRKKQTTRGNEMSQNLIHIFASAAVDEEQLMANVKNKTGMLDMLHAVSEMQNKLRERGAYLVVDEFDHPLWQALGISYDDIILTDELSLSTAQARKLVELIESRKLTLKKLAYLLPYCGPADDAVVRLLEWRQDFLSMLKKSIASCSPLGVFDENIG
jgi:hypothetical protein